jgi:HEAT repeat protein
MGDKERPVAFHAYQALLESAMQRTAAGSEAERRGLARTLASELTQMSPPERDGAGHELPPKPQHVAEVRNKILQLLGYVGDADEVPALSLALRDLDTREMARFALERNPSQQATEALIVALQEVGPEFRVGVVNSLGKRRGPKALSVLQAAASDREADVRLAAVEALANFPEPTNDAIIIKVLLPGTLEAQRRASRARLRLAETLRKAGNRTAAMQIYTAIRSGEAEAPQKKAAEIGLKSLA